MDAPEAAAPPASRECRKPAQVAPLVRAPLWDVRHSGPSSGSLLGSGRSVRSASNGPLGFDPAGARRSERPAYRAHGYVHWRKTMGATKRSLAKCLAAVALVAAMVAAPAVRAAEPGKLLVWINGDKGFNGLQKVGDGFAAKNGVQVTVEHPEDAPGKFQQAAAAGKGPDIWCWPHDPLGQWIQGGLIVPVTPGKKVVDGIDAKAWSAFTVDGKIWGYPLSLEAIGLVYNKDLVKTPPKSFDDVIALDKKLSKQGKKAILWDYNNTYFTWPLLAANGGYVFKRGANGNLDPAQVGVNSPGALKGATLLATLIEKGVMPKGANYSAMEAGFSKGEVAMMINGPWSWENARKAGINFGVAT